MNIFAESLLIITLIYLINRLSVQPQTVQRIQTVYIQWCHLQLFNRVKQAEQTLYNVTGLSVPHYILNPVCKGRYTGVDVWGPGVSTSASREGDHAGCSSVTQQWAT